MSLKKSVDFTLLIDDDKLINFYNSKVVNKSGSFNQVLSLNSGVRGLDYLKKAQDNLVQKPNLIFLDLNMPAMNGWEFLEEYKAMESDFTKDIKVIILTTSSNPDDYEKSKNNENVSDFINKPLSVEILSEVIENHYECITAIKKT